MEPEYPWGDIYREDPCVQTRTRYIDGEQSPNLFQLVYKRFDTYDKSFVQHPSLISRYVFLVPSTKLLELVLQSFPATIALPAVAAVVDS